MSQIPFVNMLGDELERAAGQRQRSRRPRRRRFVLFAVIGALAVSGTAAATSLLSDEVESQASTGIACYDGAGTDFKGSVTVLPQIPGSTEQSPVERCRKQLSPDGKPAPPLVACSARRSVAVIPGRDGAACAAAGFAPLVVAYEPARARTAKLERRLLALESSADCIAPAQLARRVQLVLDRTGWTGWIAHVLTGPREGPCGTVSNLGGDGERYVEGALDPVLRRVAVSRTASRRLTDLLFSAKSSLLAGLFDESAATCFTPATLRARAAEVFAAEHIDVTLRRIEFPPGSGLSDEDGRWTRYVAGCTIVAGARPGANDHSVVIEVFRKV